MVKKLILLGIALVLTQGAAGDANKAGVETVNSFEKLFGVTQGKRRNHTKGFCFEGRFLPIGEEITKLSNSPIFAAESTVTGRLSHKGGNNEAPDNKYADYGIGLSINTATGDKHLMSLNTLDFFPVATPQAFAELTAAQVQGKDAVKAFKEKNSDLQRFKAHASNKDKTLKPYEGSTYNSVNSFYLVNSEGEKTAIRWSLIPTQDHAIVLEPAQNFFFDNMMKNLETGDIAWDMVVTLANDDDDVDNAAIPWQGQHQKLVAARLVVDTISTEQQGNCDAINFDPLVLSPGFEPSADPLLQARRAAYAASFGRRLSE